MLPMQQWHVYGRDRKKTVGILKQGSKRRQEERTKQKMSDCQQEKV